MVGKRPHGRGRGGGGGAVSVAKRSLAQGSKVTGRPTPSVTSVGSESLSALVQGEGNRRRGNTSATVMASSGGDVEEDVTFVYRKPRTRLTKQLNSADGLAGAAVPAKDAGAGAGTAATTSAAGGSTSEEEVISFCQRVCSDINRVRALSNCGVSGGSWESVGQGGGCALSQEQLFSCSVDRMETARRALHNLNDLLYSPADTSAAAGAPCIGYPCWVRPEQYAAVVALARVCEAAVPVPLPSMLRLSRPSGVSPEGGKCFPGRKTPLLWTIPFTAAAKETGSTGAQGGAAEAEGASEATIDLVPSPVLFADVQKRHTCLRRLHELQVAYGERIPAFRAASTFEDLRHVFFAHDAAACHTLGCMCQAWRDGPCNSNTELAKVLSCFLGNPLVLDTLLPFVGITARYPQEEALVQSYVAALKNTTAVEAASWGPLAATASWRCTDGLYVVHHASRVHVLRRLLNEAQLYGLPLFLRSIRAMAGSHVESGFPSSAAVGGWHRAAALKRVQSLYADQFFLTPDCLDPDLFSQPDPMQAQLVQEELVTLQRTYCAFCLVVGEADEVLTFVHQHMRFLGSTWQQRMKKEEEMSPALASGVTDVTATELCIGETDRIGTGSARAPLRAPTRCDAPTDPLRHYVIRTVDAARRHQRSKTASSPTAASSPAFSHVQWIERGGANRWSPDANYYGLAYMVVLETEEEWATEGNGVLVTEGLLPETAIARVPAYCVNAMLQLCRT
ncbi:hypothetical protein JKF63_00514 [Porcisia hertigi]|uniref:Uncharacterized protein n=1 Tax=Porcisia hertigi TaxID=2761500 RepID=A0A836HD91_9TRYP|nr:hypothetical protein JKF63_00514 [Porcisia hertigi]